MIFNPNNDNSYSCILNLDNSGYQMAHTPYIHQQTESACSHPHSQHAVLGADTCNNACSGAE